jgi:hypothetical protein
VEALNRYLTPSLTALMQDGEKQRIYTSLARIIVADYRGIIVGELSKRIQVGALGAIAKLDFIDGRNLQFLLQLTESEDQDIQRAATAAMKAWERAVDRINPPPGARIAARSGHEENAQSLGNPDLTIPVAEKTLIRGRIIQIVMEQLAGGKDRLRQLAPDRRDRLFKYAGKIVRAAVNEDTVRALATELERATREEAIRLLRGTFGRNAVLDDDTVTLATAYYLRNGRLNPADVFGLG